MAKKQINIRAGFDLRHFSNEQQNLVRGLRKTAGQFKQIGKEMAMNITAPLAVMGGLAVKTFADFEQSMAKVNAVSGATATQFKMLNKLAQDLGASTQFSATEVSGLMLSYSKLGFSSGEIEKITEATLNLALATGEDLAKSAEVAGGALRGFGLDSSEMKRVVNTMAAGFSMSALDLDKFQLGMGKVSAVAKNAGVSLESTTAMLGVLANNNIQAATAGTGLKNILLILTKTGMTYDEAMNKIATSTDKNKTALDMFGQENTAVAVTLSANTKNINDLTDAITNAKDPAAAMAAIMANTLQGSLMILKSKVEALGISFGEGLAPIISKVAEKIGGLANWFTNLSPQVKDFILIVAGLAAAIGPLVYGIGLLTSAMAMLALPMAPYIILFVAITAAVVALGVAMAHTSKVFPHVEASIKTMKTSYEKLGEQIGKINDLKKQGVLASGEAIKANIAETRSVLAKTAADVKGAYEKRQALLDELKSRKELHKGKMFTFGSGTTAMTNVVETKKTQESINQLNIEISAAQQQMIAAGQATKDLELQLQGLENVDLAPLGDKIGTVGKEIKQLGIDFKEGIAASDLQSPAIDAIQKGLKSKGLTFDEPIKIPLEIDIKPIEITQELFDQQAIAAAKRQAADLGEEMGDALSSGLKSLATEGLTQFGEFLGNVISGGDMTVQDFGRGLLDSIGKFMSQFGEAMIAMGIAQTMLDAAIKTGNGPLAIIGGVALVVAGAAISNLSQKGIDKSGGMDSSFSGGGNFSSMSGIGANMQPIVLDTRLSGRDMIITQGRESQFRR
jgi:hypothetical protein